MCIRGIGGAPVSLKPGRRLVDTWTAGRHRIRENTRKSEAAQRFGEAYGLLDDRSWNSVTSRPSAGWTPN